MKDKNTRLGRSAAFIFMLKNTGIGSAQETNGRWTKKWRKKEAFDLSLLQNVGIGLLSVLPGCFYLSPSVVNSRVLVYF
jgi:hypothetical protein